MRLDIFLDIFSPKVPWFSGVCPSKASERGGLEKDGTACSHDPELLSPLVLGTKEDTGYKVVKGQFLILGLDSALREKTVSKHGTYGQISIREQAGPGRGWKLGDWPKPRGAAGGPGRSPPLGPAL